MDKEYLVQFENGLCFSWGFGMLRYDKITPDGCEKWAQPYDDAVTFDYGQAQKISSVLDTLNIPNNIVEFTE